MAKILSSDESAAAMFRRPPNSRGTTPTGRTDPPSIAAFSPGHGDRIDLAHTADFRLGASLVRPATREVMREDGVSEVLEPRVMQVLVALAQADGAILTRDDLTRCCWEDRIVGEDAINRVISRLRRVAEGAGESSFRVDTITKVGYRLVRNGGAGMTRVAPPEAPAPTRRRLLLAGGAFAALGAAGGSALWFTRSRTAPTQVSPEVTALMQQAQFALDQDTREGQNQAIGLYRRVVALAPDHADAWGALGEAYTVTARFSPSADSAALRERSRAAARRALALDPGNAFGRLALACGQPLRGNWWAIEQALRRAISDHPAIASLKFSLGLLISLVGRCAESAQAFDTSARLGPPNPDIVFQRIIALWRANRLEEADRLMADGATLYPTHFAIWFARFYVLLYSGRAAEAIALGENRDSRPSGIPDDEFESILAVARAVQSRVPAQIDKAMRLHLARAGRGNGYAENTIQFACVLGRIDYAFAVAEAYYFDRGFTMPEVRFTPEQGSYLARADRFTNFLFNPSTAPMRADPRFARLTRELGLEGYWTASGTRPDYRRV